MKALKIYEGLSAFLIDSEGNVYNKDGQPEPMATPTTYKLLTDEVLATTMAKNKVPVRLVRRFTKEEVVKMYNSVKAKPYAPELPDSLKTIFRDKESDKSFLKRQEQTAKDLDAASKRTVKANPKTPAKLKKKVAKAVKAVTDKATKYSFQINGTPYDSARKASKALGVSVNTVLTRCRKNADGWFMTEVK